MAEPPVLTPRAEGFPPPVPVRGENGRPGGAGAVLVAGHGSVPDSEDAPGTLAIVARAG
ncbi:hypothetical protein [Streptomyces wuyuanensis]|uniref:hypothetical protein n=1 Tax=Streptomyces wuyuanensis TaxID=1196353 RepID=UPI003720A96C